MDPRDDITITLRVNGERLALDIESKAVGPLSVPIACSILQLADLRKGLAVGLAAFVRSIAQDGAVRKDVVSMAVAISSLFAMGAELGCGLLEEFLPAVEEHMRLACPAWSESTREGYRPPRVKFVGSRHLPIPLELVPLFDTSELEIANLDDVLRVAARFPVFSTIFYRNRDVPGSSEANEQRSPALPLLPDIIENIEGLRLRYFQHVGLVGAKLERSYFESVTGLALRGPWPDQDVPDASFVTELVSRMRTGAAASDASAPGSPDHVQHYICHCDTAKPDSRDYEMILAHTVSRLHFFQSVRTRSATLSELKVALFSQFRKSPSGALVFLNACGSSKVTPDGAASFPDFFLKAGSVGVIGTEAAIPDLAAAEFAKRFYGRFLEGFNLGESLFAARMGLLAEEQNPVGALYSSYANCDLRLRAPAGLTVA